MIFWVSLAILCSAFWAGSEVTQPSSGSSWDLGVAEPWQWQQRLRILWEGDTEKFKSRDTINNMDVDI